jgi:hypothetical protein
VSVSVIGALVLAKRVGRLLGIGRLLPTDVLWDDIHLEAKRFHKQEYALVTGRVYI